MEIIFFSGGLGNQLFQYAFYLTKREHDSSVVVSDYWIRRHQDHNGYELNRLFGISVYQNSFIKIIIRFVRKLLIFKDKKGFHNLSSFLLLLVQLCGIKIIHEQNPSVFKKEMLLHQSGLCFSVVFCQTEKYFLPIRDKVLHVFQFDETAISPNTADALQRIKNTNSVSIHIRRGDFLSKENKALYGNIATPDYYQKAIAEVENKVDRPVFFVFSDDIAWVKANMSIPDPNYIDWNKGENSWQDMFLMSQCQHNVIANSTFSWWGAWLNKNTNKIVIAPAKFVNHEKTPDIYPPNWIIIH